MNQNIINWLEKTASFFPDRTAFVDENSSYTWSEVRQKALSIAYHIERTLHVRKQPVVVYMERSADMLIAFMGVACSGNFYSPLTPDMPIARINKILGVLQPALCITKESLVAEVGKEGKVSFEGSALCFENIVYESTDERMAEYLSGRVLDTDILFVLFTSGSTGIPKGVANTHRAIMSHIGWFTERFQITEEDSFGNQSPLYFDNSNLDIYSAVKTGAAVYIIPPEYFYQPVKLLSYLAEKKISTIFWVPSAMIMVSRLRAFRNVDISSTLKRAIFCGEVMPNKQLNLWRKYLPDVVYANFYGPTEISIACTHYIVDREFSDEEPLPIGNPIPNYEILVLNEKNELITESGESGELCVRGTPVAAGYYNNQERTAAAFVQNPLQTAYEEKIYRTGDIVRYNERHELMYLSRKDFQIKHLGHRIELGEIETAAASLEGISLCCCLYDEKHGHIILFVEGEYTKDWINDRLKNLIPEYMLPGKVICEERLPLNPNGKIDRMKLREKYII